MTLSCQVQFALTAQRPQNLNGRRLHSQRNPWILRLAFTALTSSTLTATINDGSGCVPVDAFVFKMSGRLR